MTGNTLTQTTPEVKENNPINVGYLRQRFQACCRQGSPIQNITLVGAEYFEIDDLKTGMLGANDFHYLQTTIETHSEQLGIPMSDCFNVNVVNINERFGGKNFMDPAQAEPADLVVICRIWEGHDTPEHRYDPNSFLPEAWLKATQRTGASIVATITDTDYEINATHFMDHTGKRSIATYARSRVITGEELHLFGIRQIPALPQEL